MKILQYPPTFQFAIRKGQAFYFPLEIKDNSGAITDLTGKAVVMQLRATATSPTVLLEWSIVSGGIVIMPDKSLRVGVMTPAETAAITFLNAIGDLTIADDVGMPIAFLVAGFTIEQGITR